MARTGCTGTQRKEGYGVGRRPASEAATGQKQGGNLFDNWVWGDSQDALIAGSSDPQVRAGVLRILATLPDVSVTSGTFAGQPTLVLSAGTAEVGSDRTEQLTINATTGIPMSFASGAPGQPASGSVSYQVSRVSTSDIAAGKFSRTSSVDLPRVRRSPGQIDVVVRSPVRTWRAWASISGR